MLIRVATKDDAKELSQIYNVYVLTKCVSYEYDAVTVEDFADRIEHYSQKYPYLVAQDNGKILGYAYATTFRTRLSFNWDTEVSVYLDPNATGKGIGTMLMDKLLFILKKCNFVNVYSYINFPNEASMALHEKFGFKECAFYKKTGYKMGAWRDLIGLHKSLVEIAEPTELDYNWQKYV